MISIDLESEEAEELERLIGVFLSQLVHINEFSARRAILQSLFEKVITARRDAS